MSLREAVRREQGMDQGTNTNMRNTMDSTREKEIMVQRSAFGRDFGFLGFVYSSERACLKSDFQSLELAKMDKLRRS